MKRLEELTPGEIKAMGNFIRVMGCCTMKLNDDNVIIGDIKDRTIELLRITHKYHDSMFFILKDNLNIIRADPRYHHESLRLDCGLIPIEARSELVKNCERIMVHNYHPMEIAMLKNIKKWLKQI